LSRLKANSRKQESGAEMSTELTLTEIDLVRAYQATPEATERTPIILRYAEFMNLSLGRAEDQLDLWTYMLQASRTRNRGEQPKDAVT
jgi:hypothetical protein